MRLRALFVALVLGWLGLVFLAEEPRQGLILKVLGGAFVVGLLLGSLGGCTASRFPRVARGADFLLWTACASALLFEVALRMLAGNVSWPILQKVDGTVFEQVDMFRFAPHTVRMAFPCNERGYYDESFEIEPPDGVVRIVAFGDSFGTGIVPHHYHYTTLCERLLPSVRIDNISIDAAGPREYLHLLRSEGLALQPDAVLLCIFVGNDPGDAWRGRSRASWFERQFDGEHVYLSLIPERLSRIGKNVDIPPGKYGSIEGDTIVLDTEKGEVRVPLDSLIQSYPRLFPWIENQELEKPTFTEEGYLEIATQRAAMICTERKAMFSALQEDVLAARELCGEIPLLVLLIPDHFQIDDELWREVEAGSTGPPLERDRAQRILGEWLTRESIPHVDLLPALRRARQAQPGKRFYSLRNTHFNVAGNAVAGEVLAEFLGSTLGR